MVRQVTGWTGISSFSGVFATMSTGHGTDSPPQAELSGEKSESPSVLARLGLFKMIIGGGMVLTSKEDKAEDTAKNIIIIGSLIVILGCVGMIISMFSVV